MDDMDGRLASLSPDGLLDHAGADLAKAVFRTANCLLAAPKAAEEVTLDVLISLHGRLEQLEGSELESWLQGLPSWLDHAATSKTKSRAAKKKRHAKRLDELVLLGDQLDAETPAHARNAALVKEVLDCLSRRNRFVYVLSAGLGHGDGNLASLLGTDEATVAKTKSALAAKLRSFAAHTLEQRELLEAMAAGGEQNPTKDYVRVYGELEPATQARLLRRLSAVTNKNDSRSMEMSRDSMFDGGASGFYPRPGEPSPREQTDTEHRVLPPPEPAADEPLPLEPRPPQWPMVLLASVGLLALVALSVNTVRQNAKLDALGEQISKLGASAESEGSGPVRLEPGKFFDLEYDSRVEPSKDGEVELLRSDAKGAELRLNAGSLAFHVKSAEGVEWIVHDGRYDISSAGKRFLVTHTGAVPEVEVYEGKVRVSGGLLGGEGVEVSSADRSLAAVMAKRPEASLAELPSDDKRDASELELDELFARAMGLRADEPKEAEDLFRDIEIRGGKSWISERALDQLRTLVTPDERAELAESYLGRFPEGQYLEEFGALRCQTRALADEAQSCWEAYVKAHPNSLYGPGSTSSAPPEAVEE